ncbi:uncharacterized protein [Littorina saxatilis]|uniref:G-protein coupled receptors family 1 profile domain-containing protein n=1 Tax=Littorina saxatilis TaxID=31220 RepID=A0AAN9G9T8_9CAEN
MGEPLDVVDSTPDSLAPSATGAPGHDSHPDFDVDDFLRDKNLAFTSRLAPTVAYIVVLSAVGLVCNTIVFVVFYRRFKPSVTRTYILAMSVCDLLSNALFLPTDVVEIRFHATFYAAWACKLSRSVRGLLTFFSAAMLVAVALDRQRTICSRTGMHSPTQAAFRRVYISLVLCGVASLAFTAPYAVLPGAKTVRFAGSNVTGVTCAIQDQHRLSSFALVYNVVTFVGFVICVVIMSVSYGRIAHFLWLQRKARRLREDNVGLRAGNVQPKSVNVISKDSTLIQTFLSTCSATEGGEVTSLQPNVESSPNISLMSLTTDDTETKPTAASTSSYLSIEPNDGSRSKARSSPNISTAANDPHATYYPSNPSTTERSNSLQNKVTPSQTQITLANDLNTDTDLGPNNSNITNNKVIPSRSLVTQTNDLTAATPKSGEEEWSDNNKGASSLSVAAPIVDFPARTFSKPSKIEGLSSNKMTPSPEGATPVKDLSANSSSKPGKIEGACFNKKVTFSPVSAPMKQIPARTTLMLFVLTALYVVNYLPYLVMSILDALDNTTLDQLDINIANICWRSFFLNSVVNPFVYNFCNSRFRQECRAFVCRRQS